MKLGLLWRDVLFGSCNSFHNDFLSTESEVSQFDERQCLSSDILSFKQNVFGFEVAVRNTMVMQFLNALAYLQDTLQTLLFAHLVVLTQIQRIPKSSIKYQRDPPEQYSVMYHTTSGWSIMS